MDPIARPVNPTSVGQLGGTRGSRVYRGKDPFLPDCWGSRDQCVCLRWATVEIGSRFKELDCLIRVSNY